MGACSARVQFLSDSLSPTVGLSSSLTGHSALRDRRQSERSPPDRFNHWYEVDLRRTATSISSTYGMEIGAQAGGFPIWGHHFRIALASLATTAQAPRIVTAVVLVNIMRSQYSAGMAKWLMNSSPGVLVG